MVGADARICFLAVGAIDTGRCKQAGKGRHERRTRQRMIGAGLARRTQAIDVDVRAKANDLWFVGGNCECGTDRGNCFDWLEHLAVEIDQDQPRLMLLAGREHILRTPDEHDCLAGGSRNRAYL